MRAIQVARFGYKKLLPSSCGRRLRSEALLFCCKQWPMHQRKYIAVIDLDQFIIDRYHRITELLNICHALHFNTRSE